MNLLFIAITAARDATLQKEIRKLSAQRKAAGKFSVDILFWDDLWQDLCRDEDDLYKHFPELRPKGGKGGDATSGGSAGGGGAGGDEGGSRAPWGGGGGGGGGIDGPGGVGGIGGGGGGGGKGGPGGSGGPGVIVISYEPAKHVPAPQNLYQVYQLDAYASGFVAVGKTHMNAPKGAFDVEVALSWGPDCGPTSLWFYLDKDDVSGISRALIDIYQRTLTELDFQSKLPLKAGCKEAPQTSPLDRFSGRVYIYSTTSMSSAQTASLRKLYANHGLSVQFRSAEYLERRLTRRKLELK